MFVGPEVRRAYSEEDLSVRVHPKANGHMEEERIAQQRTHFRVDHPVEVRQTAVQPKVQTLVDEEGQGAPHCAHHVEDGHSARVHETDVDHIQDLRVAVLDQELRTQVEPLVVFLNEPFSLAAVVGATAVATALAADEAVGGEPSQMGSEDVDDHGQDLT